jgi:hypothetical protein
MKRYLIILGLLLSLSGFSQISPAYLYRVTDSTTQFGRTISAGGLILDIQTGKTYRILQKQLSSKKLALLTKNVDYVELLTGSNVSAETGAGGAWLKLLNSDGSKDSVMLYAGSNMTIMQLDANNIVFNSTGTAGASSIFAADTTGGALFIHNGSDGSNDTIYLRQNGNVTISYLNDSVINFEALVYTYDLSVVDHTGDIWIKNYAAPEERDSINIIGGGTTTVTMTSEHALTISSTGGGATYTVSAEAGTGGAYMKILGSDGSKDSVKLADGTNTTVTMTDANTITFSSLDTGATYSMSAETGTGGSFIKILGSDGSKDSVKLIEGTNMSITRTDANSITFDASGGAGATYTMSAETGVGGSYIKILGSDGSKDSVLLANGTKIAITRTDANTITVNGSTDIEVMTKEPTGFPDRTLSHIAFTNHDREFKISGDFLTYYQGTRRVEETDSLTITDVSGLHYLYFNSSDVLVELVNSFPGFDQVLTAFIYWNATTQRGLLFDERHGMVMDWRTHEIFHEGIGPRYVSGFGATFGNTTFSIDGGEWYDDDLEHITTTKTTNTVIWKDGSAIVKWDTLQTTYYKRSGNNLQYNTGTTLSTCNATNQYVAYWVFATNDSLMPIATLIGQRVDNTLNNARTNNTFASVSVGTLPFMEMKILYRVIMKNENVPIQSDVLDLRTGGSISGTTYVQTTHGGLSGLTADDHLQYLLRIDFGDSIQPTRDSLATAYNRTYGISSETGTGGSWLKLLSSTGIKDSVKFAAGTNMTSIVRTDANTITFNAAAGGATYGISAETGTGGSWMKILGSDGSKDSVKLAEGTNMTITRTDANTITFTAAGGGVTYGISAQTGTGGAFIKLLGSDASKDSIKLVAGTNITSIIRTNDSIITINADTQGAVGLVDDINFEFADIVYGVSQTYTLDIKASYGYTITSAVLETDTGTLTGIAVKINTTAVTSLSSVTADSGADETNATGANTVVAGDRVYIITAITYTGAPTVLRGKLKITRT